MNPGVAAALVWLAVGTVILGLGLRVVAGLAASLFPDEGRRYLRLVRAARTSPEPTEAEADALWCAERDRELAE